MLLADFAMAAAFQVCIQRQVSILIPAGPEPALGHIVALCTGTRTDSQVSGLVGANNQLLVSIRKPLLDVIFHRVPPLAR